MSQSTRVTGGTMGEKPFGILLPRAVRWAYVVSGTLSLASWWFAVAATRPVIASLLWGVGWACYGTAIGVVDFTVLGRKITLWPGR